jgi:glycosyltransferase involved in cell wall biosynthesis
MPVLEAMACGTPVVCSAAGSLPEVAGDAALLVPPGDERALAEAIARVLEDRELQDRLRARGRARAAQFTWERSARRHLAVYRRAAGAPAAASRWTSEEPA